MIGTKAMDKPILFQPRKRLALLANFYDNPKEFFTVSSKGQSASTYCRLDAIGRGNKSVFQMEAALRRGSLGIRDDLSYLLSHGRMKMFSLEAQRRAEEVCATVENVYDETVNRGDEGWGWGTIANKKFSDKTNRSLAMLCFQLYSMVGASFYRTSSSISYEHIRKVFPDVPDVRSETYGALSFYRQLADRDTLTLLFIRAHGQPDSVDIFPYEELLAKLDEIPGRKVMIVLACHSGALIDYVRRRDTADNYVVIPSTLKERLGWNWNEDEMLKGITDDLIRKGLPLSYFGDARIFSASRERQIAVPHLPFDVIL